MKSKLLFATGIICCMAQTEPAEACLHACNVPNEGNVHGKTIDGLECQIDWEDKDADWGYTNVGQICNGGSSEILVHCPLMRTEMESEKGLSCASATLVSQQSHGVCNVDPTDWDCVLRSQDDTGWFGWYVGSGPWDPQGATGAVKFSLHPPLTIASTEWQAAIGKSYSVSPELGASYMMSCYLPSTANCGGETCLSSLRWWER